MNKCKFCMPRKYSGGLYKYWTDVSVDELIKAGVRVYWHVNMYAVDRWRCEDVEEPKWKLARNQKEMDELDYAIVEKDGKFYDCRVMIYFNIKDDQLWKEIQKLEERLSSRFEWGLIADIQKPDYETRVAILQRKAADELMDVGPGVLEMIASRVDSNIRELEGCLKRLSAYAMLTGRPIDRPLAEDALREIFQRAQPRQLTCQDVMDTVARYYSITSDDLKSPRRSREISVPRQIAMYLCREVANVSFPRIGDAFRRDHSTIQHGCDKIAEDMKTSASLTSLISDLTRQLRET